MKDGKTTTVINSRYATFVHKIVDNVPIDVAYRAVFNAKEMADLTVQTKAMEILRKPDVIEYRRRLENQRDKSVMMKANDALRELLLIYSADVNELVSVKIGACRHCHGIEHQYQYRSDEYRQLVDDVLAWNDSHAEDVHRPMPAVLGGIGYDKNLPPNKACTECDGDGVTFIKFGDTEKLSPSARRLYRGAKMTKNGIEILMADKDAALDKIIKVLGMYQDHVVIDARVEATDTKPKSPEETYALYKQLLGQSNERTH